MITKDENKLTTQSVSHLLFIYGFVALNVIAVITVIISAKTCVCPPLIVAVFIFVLSVTDIVVSFVAQVRLLQLEKDKDV